MATYKGKLYESEIVANFTHILGLPNKTDGTLYIYKAQKGIATKPDGYYYYEGITFILDAKAQGKAFTGQLEDYMKLESNENFIGFKYNGEEFECYVKGILKKDEIQLKDKDYYRNKYFPQKINNESIVEKSAKRLANFFRNSKIDKQMNVPFIGAVMLCLKFGEDIDLTSTKTILNSLSRGIEIIIRDNPLTRRQKKEFIKIALQDSTLQRAKTEDLFMIVQEISNIYNFINISIDDYQGHDIMNSFLRIFRKWNSANANEKGEVFTPDHIAQLMYKIANCSKDNTILDPTCGSGTFLTNAMANMLYEAPSESKNIQENRLIGIEANDFNATLAGMNMMLHGDGASNIWCDDCFVKVPQIKNCYDRVLMNPPFSTSDDELKFVKVALENMREGGVLASILPKSCVKGTLEKNLNYLQNIFKISRLLLVVSLPSDLFYPNASPATCIVVFEKNSRGHSGETLLIDCSNDGFTSANDIRIDTENKWNLIEEEILNVLNGSYTEFRATKKNVTFDDELLFEAFSSKRAFDLTQDIFDKYMREKIASQILCGRNINIKNFEKITLPTQIDYARFKITDLLVKIEKGKTKSPNKKLENKYLGKYPVIVAKKDNNGIGGMINNPAKIYNDKLCIVSGGDGGGGKTYYCDFEFGATSFVMICDLQECYKNLADKYARFYLAVAISERLYQTIQHGRTISDIPNNIEIKLPIKSDKSINWNYMSNFVKNLTYADMM
ncbi:MAG: N-6 DNA methylase [Helicobacteraceae bacterium]|nr:N-6 DNA methylase [Helicobacteraceae bacterium]